MKKLIVNSKKKVSTKELADWFGIVYKTYCNQRKKRLEELKGFCDYDEVYGGVIIKKVYFDEYYKYQDDENRVLKVINDKYFNMDGQGVAYDELNSISGVANGLENRDWNVSPAQVRPAPTIIAISILGSLRFTTIE